MVAGCTQGVNEQGKCQRDGGPSDETRYPQCRLHGRSRRGVGNDSHRVLARANGRLIRSVTSIAENVAAAFPGGASHRWDSAGQLLNLHGRTAWFGVWLDAWAQREETPYWLTYSKNALPPTSDVQLLPELNAIPGIRAHRDERYMCIALFPPVEVGRAEVEESLIRLINQAADLVR